MEVLFDGIHQFLINFQQGHLPDLGAWNYMLMALFMMLQGRASALLGGVAASAGYLNLGLIILVALLARIFVDVFWYGVGSTGVVNKFGRRVGPYERLVTKVEDNMRQRPLRFVLLAKLSNGLSLPAVIAAGSAGIPFRRWLPGSFIGEFLWTLPLLLVGYFATNALGELEGGLTYLTTGLTVVFAAGFVLYLVRSRRQSSVSTDD